MMDVIVSHVNADFDSLGAMVGAARLYAGAVMVLPGGESAGVREFLSLHCDVLDVRAPADVDPETITRVVVVDASARSRIGEAAAWTERPEVEVHVYDHHAGTTDLEPSFERREPWGAASSILAHLLRERGEALSSVEATALLVGIYEDTGSLSFAGTTPEDVEAAAWLLRSGAELEVAAAYCRRPLAREQRRLLAEAVSHLAIHDIHGIQIGLVSLSPGAYVEGAAAVVDRLSDAEETAAAILIAPMDDAVYVIARSRSDAVDVGAALREIGGGGHVRAASACLKNGDAAETRERLLAALQRHVRSEPTAGEIMSYPVRTVSPDTPVAEALRTMTRYGHSGLLVMDDGAVAGILTRRDVDKAHHHRLEHVPVRGFMTRDVETITPETPLSAIEQTMISERIGRLPVLREGAVVGIVTRTDVLAARYGRQYLAGAPAPHEKSADQLVRERLPAPVQRLLQEVGRLAQREACEAFAVGGFVRDLLLDVRNLDLDILVEPDGVALARAFAAESGGRLKVEERFGTASVTLPEGQRVDFATARSETYAHPGALPDVEPSSVVDDLRRRDFTINAIAVALRRERFGALLDPFGGKRDLERGRLRVIHNLSFQEDPTRLFRAVRFEERFRFTMDGRTEALARHAVEDGALGRITPERLREQLFLSFRERKPLPVLLRLQDIGILSWMVPGLQVDERLVQAVPGVLDWWRERQPEAPRTELVYLAVLLAPLGPDAALQAARERLRTPEPGLEAMASALAAVARAPDLLREGEPPAAISRRLRPLSAEALILIRASLRAAGSGRELKLLDRYLLEWRHTKLEITGDDLQMAGVPPGPALGQALRATLAARLNGEIRGREEELAYAVAHARAASGED